MYLVDANLIAEILLRQAKAEEVNYPAASCGAIHSGDSCRCRSFEVLLYACGVGSLGN